MVMAIRTKEIIEAQNELDELEKFEDTHMMGYHDQHYIEYPKEKGVDLLFKTIAKKRKHLCELYIKRMELYLNIGESNDKRPTISSP
tara:strand:- start:780 stop:1040 length:261 start_codon:yes stop_codon:yes gene_type:complete